MSSWLGRVNLPEFQISEISVLETRELIKGLGSSKSYGRDELDAFSLKIGIDYLAPLICDMINISVRKQLYIAKWKQARIIPLLKSAEASRMEVSSYRPISLLPVVSKLVERHIQQQLLRHMEKNNLFHPNGHAYRPSLSTNTAMMQLLDNIYCSTDDNKMTSLMALDMSSAFDCVNHAILLEKLAMYRCSKETLQWMHEYLSFRSQVVQIGRHCSISQSTNRGVPQGSILGPLLFLIYTNEIPDTVKNSNCQHSSHENRTRLFSQNCLECGIIVQFADDLTLSISNKLRTSNQLKLNINLDRLEKFLANNELQVNASKTKILEMMIKQKKGKTLGSPPHLIVPDPKKPGEMVRIEDSRDFRILGANLQQNITWRQHLESGTKSTLPSIRRQIGALKQLGGQIPEHTRKTLAEGLILSKFTYLISQWGGATQNLITAAQRVQNRAARWVTSSSKRTKVSKLLKDTGWLSISELAIYHTLLQLWKILRLGKPDAMYTEFTLTVDLLVNTTVPRLQFTMDGFRWRSTTTWNTLPKEIRCINKLPVFKKAVKSWIKSRRQEEPD